MRYRIYLVAVLAASILVVPNASGAMREAPADRYPASCDGHPPMFHVKRARDVIRGAYHKDRIPDESPAKDWERRAIRDHKFCVQHDDLRLRISVFRERMSNRYRHLLERYEVATTWPTPESLGVSSSTLAAIRACESGGNYSTNTGNGFYGAYQFTLSTWASVGGSGNPAYASPAEQDYRAALLYSRSGSSPWPVCGV